MAEECAELAHAALKLARVERGENPTPCSREQCREKIEEEWADVMLTLAELEKVSWSNTELFQKYYDEKTERMKARIQNWMMRE